MVVLNSFICPNFVPRSYFTKGETFVVFLSVSFERKEETGRKGDGAKSGN